MNGEWGMGNGEWGMGNGGRVTVISEMAVTRSRCVAPLPPRTAACAAIDWLDVKKSKVTEVVPQKDECHF